MSGAAKTPREAALTALLRRENEGAYITIAAPKEAECLSDVRDRRLAVALAYGVTERQITLDYRAGALLARRIGELEPYTRVLLRLALYQLTYMTRIPAYAVVNESVALGRHKGERALLNGVLRRALKEPSFLALLPDRKKDEARYLSVAYGLPLPLVRTFFAEFGAERTERLAAAFLEKPPLSLRVNTVKTTREALAEALTKAGYAPTLPADAPACIQVGGNAVPEELPLFAEGHFFVQDKSSQLAVAALGLRRGMRILDACACPGGKTFSALCEAEGEATLYATDLHESKLSLLLTTAERTGLKPEAVLARDAREVPPEAWGSFDAVICDVPCSGLGVLAKKPDLRHRELAGLEELPALQLAIANAASAALKRGGRMLYATCTLRAAENHGVVLSFLDEHADFRLLTEKTFYPDEDGCDGFYYAVLEREK